MAAPHSVLDDLPFALARASVGFRRFSDLTLEAVGLESQPPGMASVLHALDECRECTVSHLVQVTQLPNGTLTGLLDTLERQQHVQRVANPQDGRSWIIQLTKTGARLCARLRKRHDEVMCFLHQGLSDAEAGELTRLLEKLTMHLRSYGPPQVRSSGSGRKKASAVAAS